MMTTEMFSGVRIVELAQFVFVPSATVLLADHGAEVIKIEPPEGDPYRFLKIGDGRETASVNLVMEQNNRGKKSIALDLKKPAGREALLRLVENADVFVTSLRPKALRGLRLDFEDLRARNPKIIYARGNGLGFRGEEADKAGYDASAFWARGGFGDVLTPPDAKAPTRSRPAMGDHAGGVSLALGIVSALFKRERTGEGSLIETSLLANAAWLLSSDLVVSMAVDYNPHSVARQEARFPLLRPYKTADGRWIQLMLLSPGKHWPELCDLLEISALSDDPRFLTSEARQENGEELSRIIGEKIHARAWEEWRPLFEAWNAPWELIATLQEVGKDKQILANDVLFDLSVNDAAKVRVVSGPVGFNGRSSPEQPRRAPLLGEHSKDIMLGLGYSEAQVLELLEVGVLV